MDCEEFFFTAPDCSKRWNQLRESYIREKRRREDECRSGSGPKKRKGFHLFNDMTFLKQHVQRRDDTDSAFSHAISNCSRTNVTFDNTHAFTTVKSYDTYSAFGHPTSNCCRTKFVSRLKRNSCNVICRNFLWHAIATGNHAPKFSCRRTF